MKPIVLSLCDYTGNMVKPWAEAGYECWIFDIKHKQYSSYKNIVRWPMDVMSLDHIPRDVLIAFAFPPCTHLTGAGARWWAEKPDEMLSGALDLVQHCWRLIQKAESYVLENPKGRLATLWRPPDYRFHPCDYAGYIDPPEDLYTKETCLWAGGNFCMPPTKWIYPKDGSKMHTKVRNPDERSVTPRGFARAVFEYNRSDNNV